MRKPQSTLDMAGWCLQCSYSPDQWGPQASLPALTLQMGKVVLENTWALIAPSASAQTEQRWD